MKPSEVTIEWLASLNPGMQDYPDNHRDLDLDGIVARYVKVLEGVFVNPKFEIHGEECADMLDFQIPVDALAIPEAGGAQVILSKFNMLHTVWREWDVRPDILCRLIDDAAREGFVYVPFSLFASKEDYPAGEVYPIAYWGSDGQTVGAPLVGKKPNAKFKIIRHADVFNSLFNAV